MSKKQYNVLVAEDENFQRLALLDILTMCEYETVAVENGLLAMEQLQNEENDFDLVLLDLIMPEMNGFEVLALMRDDPRLSQIPVVVMSSTESKDTIANCLQMGAQNYIVKPVRFQQCKALVAFMKARTTSAKPDVDEKGLKKFEIVRHLGRGAAGMVDLIVNKRTREQFALKTMNLTYLSEKDKKSAEWEVEFLRVITGPTIIKFHDSFKENQDIYIVMEYAEGGSLAQLIQKHCMTGTKFTEDQVLMYVAQITLSLLALHSKTILHRDIKTQNIFIKKGVLKLGDFGISKSLQSESDLACTMLGTPYFMSPEVTQGQPYNTKADVWAMGVIIYELATLRKPFDSENLQKLFEQIKNKPIDPLPDHFSSEFRQLVNAILNKAPDKRPSIFDIARLPCVRRKIEQFVEEHECRDEVMAFIDVEPTLKTAVEKDKDKKNMKNGEGFADYEKLEEWAEKIRADISIKDHANGWFGKHLRCAQGQDIYLWILQHAEEDKKSAAIICQKLLEKDFIQAVDEN